MSDKDVDVLVLQRRKSFFRRQPLEFDFSRIAENGRGDGTAGIDIDAGPYPAGSEVRKSLKALADSAVQVSPFKDLFQGRAGVFAYIWTLVLQFYE